MTGNDATDASGYGTSTVPPGADLWAAQHSTRDEEGEEGKGLAAVASCRLPTKAEVRRNPRSRYAVLWSLTRGEGRVDPRWWADDVERLELEQILAAAPHAAHPR